MNHEENNVPLSNEELESLRKEALQDNIISQDRRQEKTTKLVTELIERLELNINHIGGLSITVTSIPGRTCLIHPDGNTCDAFGVHVAVDEACGAYLTALVTKKVMPQPTSSLLDSLLGQ